MKHMTREDVEPIRLDRMAPHPGCHPGNASQGHVSRTH